jgi:hypothetical protein
MELQLLHSFLPFLPLPHFGFRIRGAGPTKEKTPQCLGSAASAQLPIPQLFARTRIEEEGSEKKAKPRLLIGSIRPSTPSLGLDWGSVQRSAHYSSSAVAADYLT